MGRGLPPEPIELNPIKAEFGDLITVDINIDIVNKQ